MPRKPAHYYRQSAVVPVRDSKGKRQVLLITTRGSKRWIVPKGIIEPGLTPAASAKKEAWEEAGVRGRVEPEELGMYRYEKWGGTCSVQVFLMYVEKVLDEWPESMRKRRWVDVRKAERVVDEPGLKRILQALGRDRSQSR